MTESTKYGKWEVVESIGRGGQGQSRLWTPSPDARELVSMRRPIMPIRGDRRVHVA